MKKPVLILCLLALVPYLANGEGSFKTYNKEAREKFLEENCDATLKWEKQKSLAKVAGKTSSKHRSDNKQAWDPTWESIDSRPLPAWYDQSKVGIFIHWGVFSVPGFQSEWFWKQWTEGRPNILELMQKNYKPNFTYQEFAPQFTAEFYNTTEWADLFSKSGAKYVVLTSKHHEGYTLWPSLYSFSWNAKEVGPHRDLIGELADSIRANTTLKFGLYHSLYEWYNPLWVQDRDNNHTTTEFVDFKIWPEMHELVHKYQPEIFWSDGEWEAPDTYWKSKEFLAWLYNESPVKDTVVTNDRWGHETLCKHGGYYTCADRYNPGTLQPHKWENCFTLDKGSWGYRRNAKIEEYMTPEELITTIVESVSCGGNVLVNVGPNKEGMIPPIQQERLLQMGEWLGVNGEAIYNSIPWTFQNDTFTPGVWYTSNSDETKVYAMITKWPGQSIQLGVIEPDPGMTVTIMGSEGPLEWVAASPGVSVTMPKLDENASKWVWTLVITRPSKGSTKQ